MTGGTERLLKKMHLHLTLQNLGVVAFIFILLTTITYGYLHYDIYHEKQIRIRTLAQGMTDPEWTPHKRILRSSTRPTLGWYHIAPSGELLRVDPTLPFEIEDWKAFTARADKQEGTMEYEDMTVYYAWAEGQNGMRVITFESDEVEQNIFSNIAWIFFLATICSLGIFFLMSRYLAGKAIAPIEKAWIQQKNFLADASHELRTPLTVIRTNLDVVTCSPEETVAEQEEWLTNIREETDAMSKLVESLFFLARADANQQSLECEPFDYRDMISHAVCAYTPMAAEKDITVTAELNGEATVNGDEAKLRRVLRILVENALRHTEAGGTITVRLTEEAKHIRLDVIDTGEGIAPEAMEHLFDRFYQADSSRRKGGAGLGLSIAKWVVEAHGGTISVQSTLGEGSDFIVRLPKASRRQGADRA